jgi:hypothetical protein
VHGLTVAATTIARHDKRTEGTSKAGFYHYLPMTIVFAYDHCAEKCATKHIDEHDDCSTLLR